MDIRKQLDGLLKGNGQKKILKEKAMDDKKVYDELGKALSAIDNALDELEKEREIPYTKYVEQLDMLYQDLKEIRKDLDDGRFGGEQGGDISNVGRDKLDEWAKRNEKLDTKNEEKFVGAAVKVLTGDDQ